MWWKSIYVAQAELVTDEAMYWSFINIMFGFIHWLPSPLSDYLQDVIVTGDQMKRDVTLSKIADFSRFEY